MSIEDNDNIYSIEDDEIEVEDDNSPKNFAAYSLEEETNASENPSATTHKQVSAFGLMFRIMFSPVEGWKLLRRSKLSVENLQSGCFYPLLAFLALSKFAEFIYSVNVNLSQVITQAVVAFVSYFFGYFCIPMVLLLVLPKEMFEKFDVGFGKSYIAVSLSTLALFSILTDLLPMIWPILIFLPIWTLYLMFKGVRFFKFEQKKEMRFYIFAASSVIGMPLLIDWVLNSVLPY